MKILEKYHDIYKNFPEYTPLSRLDYEADGIIGMIHKKIKIYKNYSNRSKETTN